MCIRDRVNITPNPQQPYVGSSGFAHKGGLHASVGIGKDGTFGRDEKVTSCLLYTSRCV